VRPDHPGGGVPDPLGRHHPTAVSNFILLHDMLHDKKPFKLSHCVQQNCLGVPGMHATAMKSGKQTMDFADK
jgi:hypothetical protein